MIADRIVAVVIFILIVSCSQQGFFPSTFLPIRLFITFNSLNDEFLHLIFQVHLLRIIEFVLQLIKETVVLHKIVEYILTLNWNALIVDVTADYWCTFEEITNVTRRKGVHFNPHTDHRDENGGKYLLLSLFAEILPSLFS